MKRRPQNNARENSGQIKGTKQSVMCGHVRGQNRHSLALYAKLAHITQNLNIFKHIRDIPFALKERLELIAFSKVIYK
jgi:hypothetical protein